MNPLYFDYAATTPVDESVAAAMMKHLTSEGVFANPASRSHLYGWQAEAAVERARSQLAQLIDCETRELIWTSGATESNNLAIKGAAFAFVKSGKHLITSATEHKAVLDCFEWLENQGWEVTYLNPSADGQISIEQIEASIRTDTTLISLMHVNNETGIINPIKDIAQLARKAGVCFHIDAAQGAGKLPINLSDIDCDLLSLSAHKFYGPKGIGALFVRRSFPHNLPALIHGGGHERGMRSGTLATHQIVGMGEAAELCKASLVKDLEAIKTKRATLLSALQGTPGLVLHTQYAESKTFPGIINIGIEGVDGEVLLSAITEVAVSSGSACTSASIEPSHVLSAMGVPKTLALSSIRLSIGRQTSIEDCSKAGNHIKETVTRLIS